MPDAPPVTSARPAVEPLTEEHDLPVERRSATIRSASSPSASGKAAPTEGEIEPAAPLLE